MDTTTPPLASIGIDIGKEVFHIVGFSANGKIVLRRRIKRLALTETFKKFPPCVVGMEACLSAHFVSRALRQLGHEPRIIPAIYVKPFVKGQKNDYNDAEAQDQLDLQALHRVRSRLVSRRTATINQIRAFLIEQGIAVLAGARTLRSSLPAILKNRQDEISPRMRGLIVGLYEDWIYLDERIETIASEIEKIGETEANCRRLMSVLGIGPLISTAVVAAIGTGEAFERGRDFRSRDAYHLAAVLCRGKGCTLHRLDSRRTCQRRSRHRPFQVLRPSRFGPALISARTLAGLGRMQTARIVPSENCIRHLTRAAKENRGIIRCDPCHPAHVSNIHLRSAQVGAPASSREPVSAPSTHYRIAAGTASASIVW